MYWAHVVSWKHPTAQFSWDGASLAGLVWLSTDLPRPTQADLDQWAAEFEAAGGELALRAEQASRAKDVLATCATIAKYTDPSGWAALTVAQKVARVRAIAADWKAFRIFVDQQL